MHTFRNSFLLSFAFWIIGFVFPFLSKPILVDRNPLEISVLEKLNQLHIEGETFELFVTLALNNSTVCLVNIFGGFLFGFVTIVNLFTNGYFVASSLMQYHNSGLSVIQIMKYTMPHCFELIGVWLAGSVGFLLTHEQFKLLQGKGFLPNYKLLVPAALISLMIIIISAFIEAYITPNV